MPRGGLTRNILHSPFIFGKLNFAPAPLPYESAWNSPKAPVKYPMSLENLLQNAISERKSLAAAYPLLGKNPKSFALAFSRVPFDAADSSGFLDLVCKNGAWADLNATLAEPSCSGFRTGMARWLRKQAEPRNLTLSEALCAELAARGAFLWEPVRSLGPAAKAYCAMRALACGSRAPNHEETAELCKALAGASESDRLIADLPRDLVHKACGALLALPALPPELADAQTQAYGALRERCPRIFKEIAALFDACRGPRKAAALLSMKAPACARLIASGSFRSAMNRAGAKAGNIHSLDPAWAAALLLEPAEFLAFARSCPPDPGLWPGARPEKRASPSEPWRLCLAHQQNAGRPIPQLAAHASAKSIACARALADEKHPNAQAILELCEEIKKSALASGGAPQEDKLGRLDELCKKPPVPPVAVVWLAAEPDSLFVSEQDAFKNTLALGFSASDCLPYLHALSPAKASALEKQILSESAGAQAPSKAPKAL